MAGYGSVETLLQAALTAAIADSAVTVVVEPQHGLPRDLAYHLPVVTIVRSGGADRVLTLDEAVVDVDVYAADYQHARDLAELIRRHVRLNLPGHHAGGLVVSRTGTNTGPISRPWLAENIHRVGATYDLTVHARLAA